MRWVVSLLIREGRVTRGYLGISGQRVPLPVRMIRHYSLNLDMGVQVLSVEPSSPAQLAGLRAGDVIISINEDPITNINDIHRRLTKDAIGKRLNIRFLRDWTRLTSVDVVPAASQM